MSIYLYVMKFLLKMRGWNMKNKKHTDRGAVGGFVGSVKGNVKFENCYSQGKIIVDEGNNIDVGDFAGRMEGGANFKQWFQYRDCS
jgi:hypothetical protein